MKIKWSAKPIFRTAGPRNIVPMRGRSVAQQSGEMRGVPLRPSVARPRVLGLNVAGPPNNVPIRGRSVAQQSVEMRVFRRAQPRRPRVLSRAQQRFPGHGWALRNNRARGGYGAKDLCRGRTMSWGPATFSRTPCRRFCAAMILGLGLAASDAAPAPNARSGPAIST